MKIVNTYLLQVYKRNGPDSYAVIIKVHELENGSIYEEISNGHFQKMERERFEKVLEHSKEVL